MTDYGPTARTLAIGHAITDVLRQKGWTATALADVLGWRVSKVSRITTGVRRAHPDDVIAILAVLGVVGQERDELIELARNLTQVSWWQERRTHTQPTVLNRIELAATTITTYGADLVPPPLHTPDYLGLLARSFPLEERDEYVSNRLKAQQQLLDEAPDLHIYLDELAMTRIPPETMSAQIHHLLRLAVRPEVTIRVVPEQTGPGRTGPFSLMTFASHSPLVYLEHHNASAYLEDPDTIIGYRSTIADLRNRAMSDELTREWLLNMANRLGSAIGAVLGLSCNAASGRLGRGETCPPHLDGALAPKGHSIAEPR